MSVNLKHFIPKGAIWDGLDPNGLGNSTLDNLLSGIQIEFQRVLDSIKHLYTNLLVSTIDDDTYADLKLKECVPNLYNQHGELNNSLAYILDLYLYQKVNLLEYLLALESVNTETDLEGLLTAYGIPAGVYQFIKVPFRANMGLVNFPLYQENIQFVFEVYYTAGANIDAIKDIISSYKPANTHVFYTGF